MVMKILDRYILKKILSTFLFVTLMFTSVIVVITLTEKMDYFTKNDLSAWEITAYFLDFTPWIMGQLAPITVFIATVFITSRMAAHTEIIAMLSGGMSFIRFLRPYLVASCIIAISIFYLNGWVIPKSNRDRIDFEMKYFGKGNTGDRQNLHMQISPNVNLYLHFFNHRTKTGTQFTLERFENGMLMEKLSANNIAWDTVTQKWKLKHWKLKKVEAIFSRVKYQDSIVTEGTELDTLLTVTPKDLESYEKEYDALTIPELNETIAKRKFRGQAGVELFETEKFLRYSIPCTTFILVFMGAVVSSRKSRGGTGFQIALGFLLAFVFIIFFTLARTFSEAGSLAPLAAAWLPNIIFIGISTLLYKLVPR